jgi:hypothetical protein
MIQGHLWHVGGVGDTEPSLWESRTHSLVFQDWPPHLCRLQIKARGLRTPSTVLLLDPAHLLWRIHLGFAFTWPYVIESAWPSCLGSRPTGASATLCFSAPWSTSCFSYLLVLVNSFTHWQHQKSPTVSNGQGPGIMLNILQCTESHPP